MSSNDDKDSVLIVSAEPSSTLYALRLIQHWKKNGQQVSCFGIGDQEMVREGFDAIARSEDLAVVGLVEVIEHWGVIKKAFYDVLEEVEKRKPKFALLLDYPGFNLRLAKRLKKSGVKVIYYISPQIWAWRQGRVKQIKENINRVLTIFPFETEFYKKHGVEVDFVGHPLLDEISKIDVSQQTLSDEREKLGLNHNDKVLALMPGSRRSEISHHLEVQLKTAEKLCRDYPEVKPVLLVAPGINKDQLEKSVKEMTKLEVLLLSKEPFEMIRLSDLVLCASGTATIMVGLLEKPMVIMYRMKPLTALLAKMLVGKNSSFGMVNLILGEKVIPECFQEEAEPQNLSKLLRKYISNDKHRMVTVEKLKELKNRLGSEGATTRVAQSLERYF